MNLGKSGKIIEDIPWVEKYRPRSLDDIASQSMTIQTLKDFVKKGTFPHLIFTGPAGTGKTSAAVSLINDLIGPENITQDAILEKNASDESRMRDLPIIKNFVYHTGICQENSYKFVLLDESDNLSRDVQSAFRRIIEMAPPNVKFIFMCNFVERIIDPILSRCAIFRFYPLPREDYENQLKMIATSEGIIIEQDVLDAIFFITNGDMRQAINLFQMIASNIEVGAKNSTELKINSDVIYEISGFLTPSILKNLYTFFESQNYMKALDLIHEVRGISSRGVLRQLMSVIIENKYSFPKLEKLLVILAEYDYRLTLQADPDIQIEALFAEIITRINN
jgi:replication factor C small subunit